MPGHARHRGKRVLSRLNDLAVTPPLGERRQQCPVRTGIRRRGTSDRAVGGAAQLERLERFAVPTIAVIVGLDLFPKARVFHRSIDTWLAVWTTLVGATGLIRVGMTAAPVNAVWSWVGAGVALATLSYGAN